MSDDRGSASVALLGVVVPILVVGLGLVVGVAQLAVGAAAAQAGADAAALAAAPQTFRPFADPGDPAGAARVAAADNGTRLESCACPVDREWGERTVVVGVRRDVSVWGLLEVSVRARAAAAFRPVALLAP